MRSCSGSPRCLGTDGTLPRLWRGASTVLGGPRVPPAAQPQGPMLAPRRDRSGPTTQPICSCMCAPFYAGRMEIAAYQHGLFPRSESVVAVTRDLERGRTTEEAVEAAFVDDREAFIALQRE